MSILITGVDMPVDGDFALSLDVHRDGSVSGHWTCKIKGARAVQLPPHGDLIESEPIKRFITDGLNRKEFGYDQIQVLTEIEYAPVIIPADK